MSSFIESFSRSLSPRVVIADAMMVAQARFLNETLSVNPAIEGNTPETKEAELKGRINSQSSAKCYSASHDVIVYLSKYLHLVQNAAILSGEHLPTFRYHGMFLVLGSDESWYAGSPANNTDFNPRFSKLYSSSSLERLLSRIKYDEGGVWPSKKDIEEELKNDPNRYFPREQSFPSSYIIEKRIRLENFKI